MKLRASNSYWATWLQRIEVAASWPMLHYLWVVRQWADQRRILFRAYKQVSSIVCHNETSKEIEALNLMAGLSNNLSGRRRWLKTNTFTLPESDNPNWLRKKFAFSPCLISNFSKMWSIRASSMPAVSVVDVSIGELFRRDLNCACTYSVLPSEVMCNFLTTLFRSSTSRTVVRVRWRNS